MRVHKRVHVFPLEIFACGTPALAPSGFIVMRRMPQGSSAPARAEDLVAHLNGLRALRAGKEAGR